MESSAGRDLENGNTWTLSYLWLQSAVREKQVGLKKVQSESNRADLGAKALEQDKTGRHMKNLECVRFDQLSPGLTVEVCGAIHHRMAARRDRHCHESPRPTLLCSLSRFPHICTTKSFSNRAHASHRPDPSELTGG